MKKIIVLSTLLMSIYISINCTGMQEKSSITGRDEALKHNVIFYGTFESQSGHKYTVEYITFNKLVKQIPVYAMPSKEMYEETGNKIKKLSVNPSSRNDGVIEILKIDLSETKSIEVPEADVIWAYRDPKKTKEGTDHRRDIVDDPKTFKYIEIIVTDNKGKVDHYLVERKKTVYLSEKTEAGPKEMDVPLPAVKRLTIEGFRKREDEKTVKTAHRRSRRKNGALQEKVKTAAEQNRSSKIIKA